MELIVAKTNGRLVVFDLAISFEQNPITNCYEVCFKVEAKGKTNLIYIPVQEVTSFYIRRRQDEQNTNL